MIEQILDIARAAGEEILQYYGRDGVVDYKADDSPLTQADRASHRLICRRLADLTPDVPVLSEESDEEAVRERRSWRRFWLVDPLDGTKEFIKKSGDFTVNIALIEDGAPVLGVIYVPVRERFYYAARGEGAFRQDAGEAPRRIAARRADPEGLVLVASKDHAGPAVEAMLRRMPNPSLASMGSSLKFCLVAEGAADLYPRLSPTMEWDTAAAQCIVEAAGGTVTDAAGTPLRYNKEDLRNPSLVTAGDPSLDWKQYLD